MTTTTFIILFCLIIAHSASASIPSATAKAVAGVWRCEDERRVPRSQGIDAWGQGHHSEGFRRALLSQWESKLSRCLERLRWQQQHTIPTTGDWQTSVRLVQRVFPGTSSWLLYISHREGGWGPFKMNYQGSGCGGWMQFMPSTYWANSSAAFAAVRSRGYTVDPANDDWRSPLGQAITAGYMKWAGREGCHWCL
jgi:hypothetical protein